tara:strand:+ start:4870 stop:5160 length:291 start_codon:yes stop_codon:yes gene_type:complete
MKNQFNEQLKSIFMATDVPEAEAIQAADKITSEIDSHNPVDYAIGTHSFELTYKDYTITYTNGSWRFSDNTKAMAMHDCDIMSGLMTADAMRRQGL